MLQSRHSEFATFAQSLKTKLGSAHDAHQLIGLGEPIKGDAHMSGAAARIRGGLWEMPEFAKIGFALSVTPVSMLYPTMLAGDPKRCVHHASIATDSLSSIIKKVQIEHPNITVDNIAALAELIAKSFLEYDKELDRLREDVHRPSLDPEP